MKYRNQFLKYKVNCQQSPDADMPPGGGDNSADENNDDNNSLSFDDMWQTADSDDADPAAQPQNITVVQQDAPPSAESVFNTHVESIDFTAGIDLPNMQTALQNGDTESFNKAIRALGANAYRQSMIDTNKIINQRVDKAKNEMVTRSQTETATERAVSSLNIALPYTASPLYKPIADEAFTRFLRQKDMTVDKAIEKTGAYFAKFAGDVSKLNPKPPGSRSAAGFGVIDENAADGEGQDWMDFLGKAD